MVELNIKEWEASKLRKNLSHLVLTIVVVGFISNANNQAMIPTAVLYTHDGFTPKYNMDAAGVVTEK